MQRLSKCYEIKADLSQNDDQKFEFLKFSKLQIDQAASLETDEKILFDIKDC